MYIAFVTPVMDVRDGNQTIDLKTMSVGSRIFVRLRFGEPGNTSLPRISTSVYKLNSRFVLFSDLLNHTGGH